jgi:medium-chain acyl-[acyl-carrier-protein] hydrolase
MNARWIARYGRRPEARARLFCFPHAGAGASSYRLWSQGLPESIEVCAVQLPGREDRLREPPIPSIVDVVAALMPHLEPELDRPFAFFGHSMGAIVAAEVAALLHARGGPAPAHLVVSARRPPGWPSPETPMHTLNDRDFIEEVQRRYGGIPPEVARDNEMMSLLLPAVRADIAALELHRPPARPPLPFPITVFGGSEDARTPREHLDAWRGQTAASFRVRVFPGGHFYLAAERAAVLNDIGASLIHMTGPREHS